MRWLIACITLFCAASVFADDHGSIAGIVSDRNGPLPGVTLTLSQPGMLFVRTAVTDSNGRYEFEWVPVGTSYDITAKFPLYKTAKRRNVEVWRNASTPISLRMRRFRRSLASTYIVAIPDPQPGEFIITSEMMDKLPIP